MKFPQEVIAEALHEADGLEPKRTLSFWGAIARESLQALSDAYPDALLRLSDGEVVRAEQVKSEFIGPAFRLVPITEKEPDCLAERFCHWCRTSLGEVVPATQLNVATNLGSVDLCDKHDSK